MQQQQLCRHQGQWRRSRRRYSRQWHRDVLTYWVPYICLYLSLSYSTFLKEINWNNFPHAKSVLMMMVNDEWSSLFFVSLQEYSSFFFTVLMRRGNESTVCQARETRWTHCNLFISRRTTWGERKDFFLVNYSAIIVWECLFFPSGCSKWKINNYAW